MRSMTCCASSTQVVHDSRPQPEGEPAHAGHLDGPGQLLTVGNVVSLPSTGLCNSAADLAAELAAELRLLADEVEAGELQANHLLVLVESPDGRLSRRVYGRPLDKARLVGLLSFATHQTISGELDP